MINSTFCKSTLKVSSRTEKTICICYVTAGCSSTDGVSKPSLSYVRSNMPRNVLQTLTIIALVSAIFFVAHNFVRYILRGKCTSPLSLYLCKIQCAIWIIFDTFVMKPLQQLLLHVHMIKLSLKLEKGNEA